MPLILLKMRHLTRARYSRDQEKNRARVKGVPVGFQWSFRSSAGINSDSNQKFIQLYRIAGVVRILAKSWPKAYIGRVFLWKGNSWPRTYVGQFCFQDGRNLRRKLAFLYRKGSFRVIFSAFYLDAAYFGPNYVVLSKSIVIKKYFRQKKIREKRIPFR